MMKETKEWMFSADMTYVSYRSLFIMAHPFLWFDAAYLLHISIEKYLKTLILSFNGRKETGHDLESLFYSASDLCPDIIYVRNMSILNKLFACRYPDMKYEGDGLGEDEFHEGDTVVKTIRQNIPNEITRDSLDHLISLKMDDRHLIIENALTKNNPQSEYWENEIRNIE